MLDSLDGTGGRLRHARQAPALGIAAVAAHLQRHERRRHLQLVVGTQATIRSSWSGGVIQVFL